MDKEQIIDDWIKNNGAASFNLEDRNIILYDGGLFSIDVKSIRTRKMVGTKKLENGGQQMIFSKKRIIKDKEYKAILWFEELNETINYLRRMKRMLNKLGYKTNHNKINGDEK